MTRSDAKKFAKRMKEFRLSKLMSQGQAAKFFGIGERTVARIELGEGCSELTKAKIDQVFAQQSHEQAA